MRSCRRLWINPSKCVSVFQYVVSFLTVLLCASLFGSCKCHGNSFGDRPTLATIWPKDIFPVCRAFFFCSPHQQLLPKHHHHTDVRSPDFECTGHSGAVVWVPTDGQQRRGLASASYAFSHDDCVPCFAFVSIFDLILQYWFFMVNFCEVGPGGRRRGLINRKVFRTHEPTQCFLNTTCWNTLC